MDADLFSVISDLAVKEDRTVSNMVQRLLRQSPPVQEVLEAESATTAAPA